MTASLLRTIPLGTRVVVRYLIEEGERASDALGELLDRTDDAVVIGTRRGPEVVPLAQVLLAKPVPPAPTRRERGQPTPI